MIHWTKELCQEKANKYQTKREFNLNDRNAYNYAYNHGFLEDICQHMVKLGNQKFKCVYSYEFPDNSVYVGITYDFNKRKRERERKFRDTVTKYMKLTGLIPVHRQLTDYLKVEEAVFLEEQFVIGYKNLNWKILNKIKTGGVGGDTLYWTKERCIEEGLKYEYKSDFNLNSKGAYDSARRNGWLSEIHSKMKTFNRKGLNLYWTKERCRTNALLYNNRTEFRKKSSGAYASAKKYNWLDDICQHMTSKKTWTLELCINDAKKYNHRTEWQKKSNTPYQIARKNNWLEKCCKHMKRKSGSGTKIKQRKWTLNMCLESALACESFIEWRTKNKNAYLIARKYNWFEECTKHMKKYK